MSSKPKKCADVMPISGLLDAEPRLKMRLVIAGQLRDTDEIDAVTDELAMLGLCRPRWDGSRFDSLKAASAKAAMKAELAT